MGGGKGTVPRQTITVVGVSEHEHILQDLDQRLYLFSFLDIVQPDYQLLQSFLILLLAVLAAATGHDRPCFKPAAPPAPRPAAPVRRRGQLTARSQRSRLTPSAPTAAHLCEGGGSASGAALPRPLPFLLCFPFPHPGPKHSSGACERFS